MGARSRDLYGRLFGLERSIGQYAALLERVA
jgi:hypothetical protein